MALLVFKRTRAGETRQGRLRWFDEAIARFLDGHLNCHFFRGFYGAQAFGASASQDISHMRRRYSALSVKVCSNKPVPGSIPLVPRPPFRSSPLSESLEQARFELSPLLQSFSKVYSAIQRNRPAFLKLQSQGYSMQVC